MLAKTILGYFGRGCLVLAPVAITVYVGWLVVSTVDALIPVGIPGLGFVLTLVLITLTGFLTSNVVGRAVVGWLESFFNRVPLVKLLYSSIKDLINAFVGDKKRFDAPVVVSLSQDGMVKALGFVTRKALTLRGLSGHVAVYFPQSYNFAGNVVLVPQSQVEVLSAAPGDVMAFIVSGGVSGLGVGDDAIPPSFRPPPPQQPEKTMLGGTPDTATD